MYKPKDTFRFWCQKTLPLVYDDSLSYYEVLCKLTKAIENIYENFDVTTVVSDKIDELVNNGVITNIIKEAVGDTVILYKPLKNIFQEV